jgi:hypothetical protein
MGQGYEPYGQIFTLAQPLFVWLIGQLTRLGLPLNGFRFLFFWFGLLLLSNTAAIARFWLGRKAAVATLFALATAITFLAEAATVTDIIPAASIATLSLVFSLRYLSTTRLYWLLLAGFVLGISLFLSPLAAPLGLATLLLLFFPKPDAGRNINQAINWPMLGKPVGVWLAGVVVALTLGLFLATPDRLWQDYTVMRRNLPLDLSQNFILVGHFLAFNLWLSLFAVYAVARLSQTKSNHALWLALIWLLAGFIWLMLQINLRPLDLAGLLPPLSLLAGWGLIECQSLTLALPYKRLWLAGITFLGISIYLLVSWQRFLAFTLREVDTDDDILQLQQSQEIANFIQQHTGPNDCVIIDDPALALLADRWPTPQLVGLSETRLGSGLLTDKQLASLIAEGQCKAIVFSRREYYDNYFKGFGGWLRQHYPNEAKLIRTRIYYR